jgi:DMSO reductase anchor subunit
MALSTFGVSEFGDLSTFARPLQLMAAGAGVIGVLCSVMVYVATQRAQWSAADTGVKFFGSALVLGASSVFAVAQLTARGSELGRGLSALLWFVLLATVVKLAFEGRRLLHTHDRRNSVHKRMARVMLSDLSGVTALRFAAGALGGLALPLLFLHVPMATSVVPVLACVMAISLLVAEFCERYLFFRAAPASRMPGGLK